MIIMRFVWFKRGVNAFVKSFNSAAMDGWQLDHFEIAGGWLGLRYLCVAVMKKDAA